MPRKILSNKISNNRKNKLSPGLTLKRKMLNGPCAYYKDRSGGVHFVKKSAGTKAVSNYGWRELSWEEAYKENFLKSQKEKSKKK